MPVIKVETSKDLDEQGAAALAKGLSALAAELLGKPESYVLAVVHPRMALLFGGASGPAAYVTLDSIGLPGDRTPEFAQRLCAFLEVEAGIPADRTYIAFGNLQRHLFAWDGKTFTASS